MQFHLKIVSCTVIALNATALHAQGLHGEIGYSSLNLKTAEAGNRPSTRENLLRGTVGYEIHPQVAIEAMLGLGIGGGTPKINHAAGVFVKPKLLGFGEQLELFGRLGYAHTKVTTASGTAEKKRLAGLRTRRELPDQRAGLHQPGLHDLPQERRRDCGWRDGRRGHPILIHPPCPSIPPPPLFQQGRAIA